MKKWIIGIVVVLFLGIFLLGDDEEYLDDYETETEMIGTSGDPDETWAIYWYLCGSDLESEVGAATDDIYEMMEADLPDNVKVVMQTGGAWMWLNDMVDENVTQRFVYDSSGLNLVDEQPISNMGDPSTLADFLAYCEYYYPADKTMVVFWNHGGGSVAGASFDENYGYDALTLDEFYQAFNSVYDLSSGEPPVDVIGFDTCLMSSIDTAYTFSGIGKYLVASEEFEPAGGWDYGAILERLADDPGMDGARLGQIICDTYMDDCGWFSEDEATLSVVDLSKIGPLMDAYEEMGAEALLTAINDDSFFGEFGRRAESTENYGGNTRDQGYSNMADLGHLARNCEDLLPGTYQGVLDALDECVLYNISGAYRENASGLSCYYSYNGDPDDLYGYMEQGCSDSFKFLYDYIYWGELTEEGYDYIYSYGYADRSVPQVPDLETDGEEDYPLYIDDDGYVVLELEDNVVDMLKNMYFELAYVDEEEDIMILLGQDNDIDADWESGVFKDNFRGVWGAIDGYPVYMEVSDEGEDYTSYNVPILLNGEEYNLRVIYDFNDEEFHIKGARKETDENGMADKNLVELKPGDEITTIHYAATISGDDDFEAVPIDTFTVTKDTKFEEEDMGDGVFVMMFEFADMKNNIAYSEMAEFTVDGDDIEVAIYE